MALRGRLPSGAVASGRIDRLAVTDRAVLFADFKSGAGEDAADYAPQMRAYGHLLAAAYPGRAVDGLLVFAGSGRIVRVDLSSDAPDAGEAPAP
ncbi:MAG: PD-(D/E)XK nuclease family protein [Rhizobiales bacterium]|nr:PD-(D/E)XK nuclease family protein [Hyphomicrobiales bacterium]